MFIPPSAVIRAEDDVPEREEGGKVPIAMAGLTGMMDAMVLRADQQPPNRTQSDPRVHVHEVPSHIVNQNGRGRDCRWGSQYVDAHESERQRVEKHLRPVVTIRCRHIHVFVAVVQFVDRPQPVPGVLRAMYPVIEQIANRESRADCECERPPRRVLW